MANVTYYIDKSNPNKKGLVPIKANICINSVNQTKTIDNVLASDWNENKQRVKPPRPGKTNDYEIINAKLEKFQSDFKTYCRECALNNIPITIEIVKGYLKDQKIKFKEVKPFWEAYDEYLQITKTKIEKGTYRIYFLHYNNLKRFEKAKDYRIDYSTINRTFADLYQMYFLHEKELGWNYYMTALKRLKFFMNWALEREYHSELAFKKIRVKEEEPTIIFLTEAELIKLYNHDFKNDRLNHTRDKFCFGCLTGLAFADLDNLTHEHIQNSTLTKYRQKTKAALQIELSEPALKIIQRYKGSYKALPKLSQHKMNKYIKECCKAAGIDAPVHYKDFTGGHITELVAPKHELVSTHTARKTFITNFYKKTKDYVLTKKNAGISLDKTIKRYIGTDQETEKAAMSKAWENIKPAKSGPEREDFVL